MHRASSLTGFTFMRITPQFIIFVFFSVAFSFLPLAFLDAATLKLSPSSGAYSIGDTFGVQIFLDTQTTQIHGADIHFLNYNPALLEVVDDNPAVSGVQIMAGNLMPVTPANTVDMTAGKIAFSQSTAGGGLPFSNSGEQVFATIHFKVKGSGYASVTFDHTPGSTTDANVVSTKGKEALTSVVNATFTLGNPQTPPPSMTIYVFTRNLRVGMSGDDVKALQQFLNNNGYMVAVSGFGSPGNETTYFGTLTKIALIKFQEGYMNEILVPVGLTRGSGYFGPATRKKLNAWKGLGTASSASNSSQVNMLQEQLRALQEQLNRLKYPQ